MDTVTPTATSGGAPTLSGPVASPHPGPPNAGPHWGRIAFGLLIAAGGITWLLDSLGVAVTWHLVPAAAVIALGLLTLASLVGGQGRGSLIVLGAVMLIVATAVGVGAGRFAGPAGDVLMTPGPGDWPVSTRLSAGTVTVDLTRSALPASGRLDVDLGAGRVEVLLPDDPAVHVEATMVVGTLTVDGVTLRQGVDIEWADATTAPVAVVLDVGAGDVEVNHGRS